ncbi:uncharacterized protein LOC142576660 [Dermacentor variabilis]|uniref:uncharacterized protein LOC142576660 n=1 Tax=Dermacentor variabilis TaxID=34621 RepID=UPI003F5BB1E5
MRCSPILRVLLDIFFKMQIITPGWISPNWKTFLRPCIPKGLLGLQNCWGFIDGTARAICRPSRDQKLFFSGHKRFHALKYQAIMCPNGIICQLNGPYVAVVTMQISSEGARRTRNLSSL